MWLFSSGLPPCTLLIPLGVPRQLKASLFECLGLWNKFIPYQSELAPASDVSWSTAFPLSHMILDEEQFSYSHRHPKRWSSMFVFTFDHFRGMRRVRLETDVARRLVCWRKSLRWWDWGWYVMGRAFWLDFGVLVSYYERVGHLKYASAKRWELHWSAKPQSRSVTKLLTGNRRIYPVIVQNDERVWWHWPLSGGRQFRLFGSARFWPWESAANLSRWLMF